MCNLHTLLITMPYYLKFIYNEIHKMFYFVCNYLHLITKIKFKRKRKTISDFIFDKNNCYIPIILCKYADLQYITFGAMFFKLFLYLKLCKVLILHGFRNFPA